MEKKGQVDSKWRRPLIDRDGACKTAQDIEDEIRGDRICDGEGGFGGRSHRTLGDTPGQESLPAASTRTPPHGSGGSRLVELDGQRVLDQASSCKHCAMPLWSPWPPADTQTRPCRIRGLGDAAAALAGPPGQDQCRRSASTASGSHARHARLCPRTDTAWSQMTASCRKTNHGRVDAKRGPAEAHGRLQTIGRTALTGLKEDRGTAIVRAADSPEINGCVSSQRCVACASLIHPFLMPGAESALQCRFLGGHKRLTAWVVCCLPDSSRCC